MESAGKNDGQAVVERGELLELVTLSCPLLAVGEMAARVRGWAAGAEAGGETLGLWRSEIGVLGRLLMLRRFADAEAMAAERERCLRSGDPFLSGGVGTGWRSESFRTFPFLPPIRLGQRGPLFELRRYRLRPGGLPPTLAGWREAVPAAEHYAPHLVVAMHALEGEPRIVHLWGFRDFEQRSQLRRAAYGAGTWPPRGGPENILHASASLLWAEDGSPLR
ncbi:NIPSNAP family protein [Rhizosaccharibacter radicis]|uniref:NIPSNAP family protein n=1 Tax=Rhizosaccharibacter radicis TaxID=2782605 RepID=A0ABT1VSM5_9PROT|nr:NIPSNAP family protein [Acetobacteraceae bacterium KSS12]